MGNETRTQPPGAIHERDGDYYLESIVFLVRRARPKIMPDVLTDRRKVEGRLFKFPRRAFETQSEVFLNMFASSPPEGQPPDGSSDDNPLLLDGYTQHDFKALLKVMLPE